MYLENSPSTGDRYNPKFPLLEGIALSCETLPFDYSSSQEHSTASGDNSTQEVFVLPTDLYHSLQNKTAGASLRSHTSGACGNGENTSDDDRNLNVHERGRHP